MWARVLRFLDAPEFVAACQSCQLLRGAGATVPRVIIETSLTEWRRAEVQALLDDAPRCLASLRVQSSCVMSLVVRVHNFNDQLRVLVLHNVTLGGKGTAARLALLSKLQELQLVDVRCALVLEGADNDRLDMPSMGDAIMKLTGLTTLRLDDSAWEDAHLEHLSALRQLHSLSLRGGKGLKGACLAGVPAQRVTHVSLSGPGMWVTQATYAGMFVLGCMRLQELHIARGAVLDSTGIPNALCHPSLTSLAVLDSRLYSAKAAVRAVDGHILRLLPAAMLPQLLHLDVQGSYIGHRAIMYDSARRLQAGTQLTYLGLGGGRSAMPAHELLHGLTRLRHVTLPAGMLVDVGQLAHTLPALRSLGCSKLVLTSLTPRGAWTHLSALTALRVARLEHCSAAALQHFGSLRRLVVGELVELPHKRLLQLPAALPELELLAPFRGLVGLLHRLPDTTIQQQLEEARRRELAAAQDAQAGAA